MGRLTVTRPSEYVCALIGMFTASCELRVLNFDYTVKLLLSFLVQFKGF